MHGEASRGHGTREKTAGDEAMDQAMEEGMDQAMQDPLAGDANAEDIALNEEGTG